MNFSIDFFGKSFFSSHGLHNITRSLGFLGFILRESK